MRKEKEKRKMIYFLLICIILVIIVITGTYAYFTAKVTVENSLTGETQTISFGMKVEKITSVDERGLIPMNDEDAAQAPENMCEDSFGYAVCQIYKITITNTGNINIYLDGYLTLETVTEDEMRFIRLYYDGDEYCFSQNCQEEFNIENVKTGIALNTDGNFNREEDLNALLVKSDETNEDEAIVAGASQEYYVLIWLHNINDKQNELQGVEGFFKGSVTFISSQGNKVSAVFE